MSELSLILKFYPFKQLISNIDNLCLQKVNTRKWNRREYAHGYWLSLSNN